MKTLPEKTAEERDWTIPDGDIIHVPDRLDDVYNRMGHYLRVHTISGINEFQVIAYMTKFCDEYASLRSEQDRKEIERLKEENDLLGDRLTESQELTDFYKNRSEELEEALRECKAEDNIGAINEIIDKALTKESAPSKEIAGEQEKLMAFFQREAKGYTEFRVVVRDDGAAYVHVLGRDSETFDFKL